MEPDRIAGECEKLLKTEYTEDLDQLFRLGGSSGGSAPQDIDGNRRAVLKWRRQDCFRRRDVQVSLARNVSTAGRMLMAGA